MTRRATRRAADSRASGRMPEQVRPAATSDDTRKTGTQRRRRTWKPLHLVAYGAVALAGIAGVVLLVRTAGPSSSAPSPAPVSGNDFRIVAYQGDDVLGGHESAFSHVTSLGKPVVLNFFAGQCPPCRAEMPGFQRVADEFQGKAIFVGVDVGPYVQLGSREDARSLLSQLKIRYPAAYAVDSAPLTIYGVQSMPTTVVFDGKGQVVETHSGIFTEAQLREKLNRLTGA